MRKWNALIALAAVVLLLIHMVLGSLLLTGAAHIMLKPLAWTAAALLLVHTVLGIKYTADSLRVWRKTGAGYFRENRIFWARRLSGFAFLVLFFFHITAFGTTVDGVFQLKWFTGAKLACQLLLVLSLAVHLLTNLRPLMLSLGVRGGRSWLGSVFFVLSVLLLFAAAAFVIYYLRWNVW